MLRFALLAMLLLPAIARADDPTFEERLKLREQEVERAKQRTRELIRQYNAKSAEPRIVDSAGLNRLMEQLQKDGLLKRRSSAEKQFLDNLKELRAEAEELRARMRELEAERVKLVEERQRLLDERDDIRKPIYRNGPSVPAPLPEGLTGKVTDRKDDRVALNIGIDAGLTVGAKMDIWRDDEDDRRYLGTIEIERVYPKEAVAKFTPANGRKLKDLQADELPKAADAVGTHKGKK